MPKHKQLEIPDHPDSPLSAWKHYGITHYADEMIQKELNDSNSRYYLAGLEVSYTFVKETKTYTMTFGNNEGDTGDEFPLKDEFLTAVYKTVHNFIVENIEKENPSHFRPSPSDFLSIRAMSMPSTGNTTEGTITPEGNTTLNSNQSSNDTETAITVTLSNGVRIFNTCIKCRVPTGENGSTVYCKRKKDPVTGSITWVALSPRTTCTQ